MTDITDITDAKVVYVSTSKNADYVSATDHECSAKYIRADAPELVAMVESLQWWSMHGCPNCGGDCSSANPPVYSCPMGKTALALAQWDALAK